VIVHSLNGGGARLMVEAIGPTAEWIPFDRLGPVLQSL
jgi:hypothetical protein